jgi:hypothetical protein
VTFIPIAKENAPFAQSGLSFMMGSVVTIAINFYLGSSKGSVDKGNQLAQNQMDNKDKAQ